MLLVGVVILLCFKAKELFASVGFAVFFIMLHAFLMAETGTQAAFRDKEDSLTDQSSS